MPPRALANRRAAALDRVPCDEGDGVARLLLARPSTSFAPSPNAPLVHRVGALVQGHDIEVRQCTFEQAKALALELPNCAGFTFNSAAPQFDGVQTVHFKDRRDGNTDWRWQSYLRADWAGADPAPLPYHGRGLLASDVGMSPGGGRRCFSPSPPGNAAIPVRVTNFSCPVCGESCLAGSSSPQRAARPRGVDRGDRA